MDIRNFKNYRDKKFVVVSIFYFCVMFIFLYLFGINTSGEAFKYILDAKSLIKGQPLNYGEFSYFYASYSFLIAIFLKLKINLYFLAVFQFFLSFFAGFCVYNLINKKFPEKNYSILFLSLYLFCYPIQKWLFFAYSEGVHTSLVVIGFYCFIKVLEKFTFKDFAVFSVFSLLIVTTRPVGIIFILSAFCTLAIYSYTTKRKKIFVICAIASVAALFIILNSPFRYFVNPDSLRRMEIICQLPQDGNKAPYSQFNRTGLQGAYHVIKNEIGITNFLLNGLKKLKSFYGLTRPYFSDRNNLFLSLYWLFYPFAIVGVFNKKNLLFQNLKIFPLIYIIITSIAIFVTCDDWSDRFIAPVFPFIVFLAALGLSSIVARLKKIKTC